MESRANAMKLQPLFLGLTISLLAIGQTKPSARQLGVPLEGTPGPLNAITDVAGVEVGHRTLISGASVRTGVTAIWPRGNHYFL
jgi:D-aminopeptidase